MLTIILSFLASFGLLQLDDACSFFPPEPGLTTYEIISDQVDREFIVYVPENYTGAGPTPLVLTLHGFGDNAASFIEVSDWMTVADDNGFLLVAPQGYRNRWNAGVIANDIAINDVIFLDDVITAMQMTHCVDASRVYLNGFSNGGGMTEHFACEMAARVAAIGTVAGAYDPELDTCEPSRALPLIAFHGLEDGVVPYDGQEASFLSLPPIDDWLASWVERNACDAEGDITQLGDNITQTTYAGCADDVQVTFYAIADGGHAWPGGQHRLPFLAAQTSREISASSEMWAFFAEYVLPDDS